MEEEDDAYYPTLLADFPTHDKWTKRANFLFIKCVLFCRSICEAEYVLGIVQYAPEQILLWKNSLQIFFYVGLLVRVRIFLHCVDGWKKLGNIFHPPPHNIHRLPKRPWLDASVVLSPKKLGLN
jgi:hypothetical protein